MKREPPRPAPPAIGPPPIPKGIRRQEPTIPGAPAPPYIPPDVPPRGQGARRSLDRELLSEPVDSPPPEATRRPSVTDVERVDTWPAERPTVARTRRIVERGERVQYPPAFSTAPSSEGPTPSFGASLRGLRKWAQRWWWALSIVLAVAGSVTLSRLWELLGLATKADLDRTEQKLLATIDGGAHDSEARKALDGGAHDHVARDAVQNGVNAAAADARAARAAAANARRLVGLDPDAGLTVTKENDPK